MTKELYDKLSKLNVNEFTEKKNGLTYLSWADAWNLLMKICPDAKYEIKTFDGKPYLQDSTLGYMVQTSITIEGDTREMWLPVMDNASKSLKDHPYKYIVRNWATKQNVEKTCEVASMFDINKAIMRCLVKNMAMFGLGLYIYAGEDLPEENEDQAARP